MIWFVLGTLLSASILYKFAKEFWDTPMLLILMGALFAAAAGFIGNALASPFYQKPVVKTYSLQSITTDSSIHGRFFLGSGTIDSEPSFTYYQSLGGGQYVLRNAPANRSVIVEYDGSPHLDISNPRSSNLLMNVLPEGYVTYTFYIPKGSVIQSYTLKP